jgi:ABC-2 type transport system permease protein
MRANLLRSQPSDVANRLTVGDEMIVQSADGSRQAAENDFASFIMPFFFGVLFMIIILTTGGYLLQAIVEEKENRTMEIMITSVSPDQLMTGKILGNISVGLTQMVAWILFIVIGILIGSSQLEWMRNVQIHADYIIMMILVLLPSFIMIGALMAALGATVTEAREAQQISGIFTLPVVAPYWLVVPLMTAPNGPLALGLSFFPLTAPVTISLRAGLTQIPYWQFGLNLAVLVLAAIAAVWLAARSFRLGMLSYGKKIALRQLFRRAA